MTSVALCLLAILAAAAAAPQAPRNVPYVISRSHQLDDAGQFSSSAAGSDGQVHQEQGILKPTADGKGYVLVYVGSYKYRSPEGIPVEIHYTADENGYHATGNVIPVAPSAAVPVAF